MSYAKVASRSMLQSRTTLGLSGPGEYIECSAENVWKYQGNRIPVFPGKVNRWLVGLFGPDDMTNEQIRTHIEFLWKDIWFSGDSDRPVVGGIKVEPAKLLKVIPTCWKDLMRDFKYAGALSEAYIRQYGKPLADAPYPIPWSFSKTPIPAYALVEFIYLGPSSSTEYFYPTFNGNPAEWDCPTGVNTMLWHVFTPSEAKGGSSGSGGSSSSGGSSGGGGGDDGSEEDSGGYTKWIIGAAAAGVGLYLWQRSRQKATPAP